MHTLIIPCANVNSDFLSSPDYLVLDVTPQLVERIKQLSNAVIQNDAFSISIFEQSGKYCSNTALLGAAEYNNGEMGIDESYIETYCREKGDYICATEVHMLNVCGATFYFEANPKGCKDDCIIRTNNVPIDALDECGNYSKVFSALKEHEWGDSRSLLDEYFSADMQQHCSYLKSMLDLFEEHVIFTFSPEEKWSYIEVEGA